jgi:DNA-binding response OmpR family regulator
MSTKILLADDSVTIQKVVELTFSDKNYEVTTVGDGESAIRMAKERRPDIILLDVIMPGMDGYEVCSVLKQDMELKDVPVLLLTGTFEVFDTERSQRVGADGYITKPFESQELIARVRRLVSQHQAESAPAEDDLDADLMLPELERDEPAAAHSGGKSGEEEDFPEFTFDTDSESLDSEILFDFSMDAASTPAPGRDAVRSAPEPAPAAVSRETPATPAAKAAPSVRNDEEDEPTFELPEFDLPGAEEIDAGAAPDAAWDDEDHELASSLAAITMPGPRSVPAAPKPVEVVADRTGGQEEDQFVFEETQSPPRRDTGHPVLEEVPRTTAPQQFEQGPSPDLEPLLERLDRLEALVRQSAAAPQEPAHLTERLDRLERLLRQAGSTRAASVSGSSDTIGQHLPEILEHISETVGARLPELVEHAAERLSARLAERLVEKLGQSGLDTREIVSAIAWQVVPDVAEMLVRREIEEIRRRI